MVQFVDFFSTNWIIKFYKLDILHTRSWELHLQKWGISGVCTLALTVTNTSSHNDRFAISIPARSLLLLEHLSVSFSCTLPWNGQTYCNGSVTSDSERFGKNMAADVSAKKYAETSQAKKTQAIIFSYDMWGISGVCTLALTVAKASSHRSASRSPFPLGLCSCSTSLSKMGI